MIDSKSKSWLKLVGSEVMNSKEAIFLIRIHVGLINEKIGEPKSVLVIGCADGTEMSLWDNSEGIDLNQTSLNICESKGLKARMMDMHKMDFNDNSFELVSSRDVFEHAISPIEAISEMSRVSSKYVAITIPDSSWQWSDWHFIIPTMEQMLSLGEKVGLKLLSYREYGAIQGSEYVKQYLYLFEKDN